MHWAPTVSSATLLVPDHRRRRHVFAALAFTCIATTLNGSPGKAAPVSGPIVFVPLDDRPVTYQLPVMLGAIAGRPLIAPPRALVGSYLQPGDPAGLARWLRSDATTGASALIASSDMVVYGGLVASRIPGIGAADGYVRLRELAALKSERAIPFVGVFATIMRLAPTGVPRLGPAANYYAVGATVDDLTAYANLPDPPVTPEDTRAAALLRERIGAHTLDAYLATRRRNRDVDEWALQMAADGGFDRIIVGQDDAGPVGLHLHDVAALRRAVRAFGLGERASIEPGADELGMVLLARVFALGAGWTPSVSVHYSRPGGGESLDRLEYAPIAATIGQIVDACGARRVTAGGDIALYVRVSETSPSDESTFVDDIARDVAAGASVAVADLTFLQGNPGEEQRALTEALIARGIAGKIDAFASWNTDANTVGTALPEAIAAGAGRRAGHYDPLAHAQFMLDRYIDDYAFHQFVRPLLNERLRASGIDTTLLLPDVARSAASLNRGALWAHALQLLHAIYPEYGDEGLTLTLPWDRTFETRIDARLSLPPPP